jgi:uncharacterized membrane protein
MRFAARKKARKGIEKGALRRPDAPILEGHAMESRAKLFGHPVHQMAIVFPLGLLGAAVVFDLLYLFMDNADLSLVSYYLIIAGIVGGLVAAPFGTIDWLAIPSGTRAKRIGAMHGGGNVLVLLLFLGSWLLRRDAPAEPSAAALLLSFAGLGVSLLTAWLGGELVSRLGVGVADNAHLDAPNSLNAKRSGKSHHQPVH